MIGLARGDCTSLPGRHWEATEALVTFRKHLRKVASANVYVEDAVLRYILDIPDQDTTTATLNWASVVLSCKQHHGDLDTRLATVQTLAGMAWKAKSCVAKLQENLQSIAFVYLRYLNRQYGFYLEETELLRRMAGEKSLSTAYGLLTAGVRLLELCSFFGAWILLAPQVFSRVQVQKLPRESWDIIRKDFRVLEPFVERIQIPEDTYNSVIGFTSAIEEMAAAVLS